MAPVLKSTPTSSLSSSPELQSASQSLSRIRIGFFSSHFNPAHSVHRMTHGVLDGLDRALFEVFLFFSDEGLAHASVYKAEHKISLRGRLSGKNDLFVFTARRAIVQQGLDIFVCLDVGMDTFTTQLGAQRDFYSHQIRLHYLVVFLFMLSFFFFVYLRIFGMPTGS